MSRRKTIIGLAALCALALSAVSAQGAFAAGSTVFTCVPGVGTLNAHCDPGSSGTSGHVAIAEGTETELTATAVGSQVMEGEILFLKEKLTGTEVDVKRGFIKNEGTTPMKASGKVELTYTHVTDSLECGVTEEMVTTSTLNVTTEPSGNVKFEAPGGVFAEIHTGCGTFNVEGHITAHTSGATLFTTAADSGLTLGGNPATLAGKVTLSAGHTGETHNPLSITETAS